MQFRVQPDAIWYDLSEKERFFSTAYTLMTVRFINGQPAWSGAMSLNAVARQYGVPADVLQRLTLNE